ncbi:MAG: hypothetical protein JST59_29660 [Actinobacteria bacterium]|nr:hypothetical protein [Actinomycetota bacterium]
MLAMRTIGEAARFFLTRHWVRTHVGPYVVTTTEVRPKAYETNVTWGEDGPEVERFGSGLAFDPVAADADHKAVCRRVEAAVGHPPASAGPAPAG